MALRRYVFLLGAFAAPVVHAATEFDNGLVPIELVRQFTGGGDIYRSLPDGFPVVALPAGTDVRLLGSMKRASTSQAVLGTSQSVEVLRAALVTAYTAAGWVDVSASNNISNLSRLCHNELGYLMIIAYDSSYFNSLHLMHSPAYFPPGQGCAALDVPTPTQWTSYFTDLMPVLSVPPQAQPGGDVGYFSSMSSSFTNGQSAVRLVSESSIAVPTINIAGLYAHFAARMVEQGWQVDSEDSGEKSAVSAWYRSAPPPAGVEADDTQLAGFLTLRHTGDDDYRVEFTLEATLDAVIGVPYYAVPYDVLGNGERPPLNEPQLGIRGIPAGYRPR